PALNIKQLLEHGSDKSGFFKPLVIGDVQEHFINNRSFILPYFTIKDQLEWTAAAVYQGPEKKMVGLLNEKELQGLDIYSGNGIQRIIDFKYKNDTFGLKIVRIKRKKSIDTTNIDNLKIKNKISLEAIITESYNKENFLNPNELKRVEEAASKKIEKSILKITDKAQEELNADIFDIWSEMETKHNNTWNRLKDDWESGENYFSKADFDIEVNTNIYSTGTINKTYYEGTLMTIWFFFEGPINWLSIFCNILVFVIPYTIYKINNKLHQYGDQSWKKGEQNNH